MPYSFYSITDILRVNQQLLIPTHHNIPLNSNTWYRNKIIVNILKATIKQLEALKPNKASGPDEIPARVLKETASELFQQTYTTGKPPQAWTTALN